MRSLVLTGASLARCAVPVLLGLTHAFAHGYTTETLVAKILEHVSGQFSSGYLVYVVRNSKLVTRLGSLVKNTLEVILSNLDIGELIIIIGIK